MPRILVVAQLAADGAVELVQLGLELMPEAEWQDDDEWRQFGTNSFT